MTHATTTTSPSIDTAMGNGNKKFVSNSASASDLYKQPSKLFDNKDVAKWSSTEVKHWIKEQCKRFELKKATIEKFEMNGQALVLLSKHDFLRRSPDGGEILYYALQRIINPAKVTSTRVDQQPLKNGSSTSQPRIVEINADNDDSNGVPDPLSPIPIIEEPDDPPKIRRSQSEAHHQFPHEHIHPFFFNQARVSPSVLTMPVGAAATYFNQQQAGALPPNVHANPPPSFFHPPIFQHFHPMMTARGILIEILDELDPSNYTANGVNGTATSPTETLYMVTVNGQQFVMNEEQVRQLVNEVYQQQVYQENLQQQHLQQQQQFFQQQHFQRQQQQHFQQQQQQQQRAFTQQQQQPPPQQQQPPPPHAFPEQQRQQQQQKRF